MASADAMTARVDQLLNEQLADSGWTPAASCSEANFLRRASLDLTGVPPTASEALAFASSPASAEKRAALIVELLKSPSSAAHLAQTWASWILPEGQASPDRPGRAGLESWLRARFAENLRYDRLLSDLMVASGPTQTGPTAFFVALEGKPEKIAAKTARVFLGLQLDCAECHDHPFDKWSQRDFWGFAAYFAQLSATDEMQPQMAIVADVEQGEVLLPGSDEVVPPQPLVKTGYSNLATGTRRQQLAVWLTARENPFVARAVVNRVWALLFGRGLIEPVDDMRDSELATHPRLLRELSEYFADSGYDLRGLIALLAKTQAYSRQGVHLNGRPPEGSYAVMPPKPLTEVQLSNQLARVARQFSAEGAQQQVETLQRQLGKLRGDGGTAQLGIVNALVTLHGESFDRVTRPDESRLLQALAAPHLDSRQQFRWLYLATLAREPSGEEQQAFSEVLSQNSAEQVVNGWQADLLWALLNSTEFAMTP